MPQLLEVTANTTEITIEAADLVLQALASQIVVEIEENGITTAFWSEPIELTVEATVSAPIVTSAEVQIVTVAEQGPPGIPGEASAAILGTFECGESISSSSLVHLSPIDGLLYRADQAEMLSASGYTIPGASAGASLTIYRLGTLNGLGGLVPGQPRWLGTNGQSRATMPTSGLIQSVGYASDVDQIFVELDEPEEVET